MSLNAFSLQGKDANAEEDEEEEGEEEGEDGGGGSVVEYSTGIAHSVLGLLLVAGVMTMFTPTPPPLFLSRGGGGNGSTARELGKEEEGRGEQKFNEILDTKDPPSAFSLVSSPFSASGVLRRLPPPPLVEVLPFTEVRSSLSFIVRSSGDGGEEKEEDSFPTKTWSSSSFICPFSPSSPPLPLLSISF